MLTNSLKRIKSLITLKRRKPHFKSKELVFLFKADGHSYYRFPKDLNLPFARFAEMLALQELLGSGLSGQETEKILSAMEGAIHSGLSNPKNAAVMSACVNLIRQRKDGIVHQDLLINIAALNIVRDDEPVEAVTVPIHNAKCDLFKRMAGEDSHGFFTLMDLPVLIPLLQMSPQDFKELWENNATQSKILADQLNFLNSRLEQSKPQR